MPRKKTIISGDPYNQPFPTRLREVMQEQGVTGAELAALLGVTNQSVSKYVNGLSTPDIQGLSQIAKRLNVSTDYLLGVTDVRSAEPDVQAVQKYTGLSEKAIQYLHFTSTEKALNPDSSLRFYRTDIINLLFDTDRTRLGMITDRISSALEISLTDHDRAMSLSQLMGFIGTFTPDDISDILIMSAMNEFTNLVKEIMEEQKNGIHTKEND